MTSAIAEKMSGAERDAIEAVAYTFGEEPGTFGGAPDGDGFHGDEHLIRDRELDSGDFMCLTFEIERRTGITQRALLEALLDGFPEDRIPDDELHRKCPARGFDVLGDQDPDPDKIVEAMDQWGGSHPMTVHRVIAAVKKLSSK